MVKCLTDFSCWETIAKLAPIGTALIVLIAAIIALGAMWVQMHIARRRADAPDLVEVGEAGIAVDDAMRRQRRVQLVG